MELVQEVYDKLKDKGLDWPMYALVVLRDEDGEIKFSSISKDYISVSPENNIYMRGQDCLFNNRVLPEPYLGYGTKNAMEIVTHFEFEQFYFTKENR